MANVRKNVRALVFVTGVVMLSVLCAPHAEAQKVGYVSTEAIRKKYEPNTQAEERLNIMVTGWKDQLAQFQVDIDDRELEIKKNRLIWSDQERKDREKDLEDRRSVRDKFAKERLEPGGEYDKQAESLFAGVWQKIYAATQKVAAAEGYDIVLDKSTQPLIYVNAKFDLTVKVMKELGIDADDMERQQRDVIENDPRNKKLEEPRRRKTRSGTKTPDAPAAAVDTVATPIKTSVPPVIPTTNPQDTTPVKQVPVPVPVPTDTTKPRTEQDVPR